MMLDPGRSYEIRHADQRLLALVDLASESALIRRPEPRGLTWMAQPVDTRGRDPFFEENLKLHDLEPLDATIWQILARRIGVARERAGQWTLALGDFIATAPRAPRHAIDLDLQAYPMTLALRPAGQRPGAYPVTHAVWI